MAPVDPSVLLDLVATGALVVAGGVVYHGHIQTGVAGRMVLIGRVAGTPDPPREIPLELALVTAVGGRLSQASRSARKGRTPRRPLPRAER
jgi:hypothetical protein